MNLFGLSITRQKAAVAPMGSESGLYSSVSSHHGWFNIIREGFAGAWQRNIAITTDNVLTYAAVYRCVTLIASDIGKLRVKLVQQDANDIWNEIESPAFSPVLRKPNRYQNRIKFFEQWVASKFIHGNTYVLKERDQRGVVVAMYVLDPMRCRPMVAPDGSVYYQLGQDDLRQVDHQSTVVPASEILHDVMVPLYHPLCGVSPISACGLAAVQGLKIQEQSTHLFSNGARPGGILTAPAQINDETAKRLQEHWEQNFGGVNAGKVAVLGDGLKYEALVMNAVDAQLIEQLKWTAENVCTAFGVPPYMIGVAPPPPYNNVEALSLQYYTQTLQNPIECIELLLDEGLNLDTPKDGKRMGTEFDLDELMRMDTSTRVKAAADAIGSGAVSPNEARKRWLDLPPCAGGETPYLQEQNWPLKHLASRELPTREPTKPAPVPALPPPSDDTPEDADKLYGEFLRKELAA